MIQSYFSSTIPLAVITFIIIVTIGSLSMYGFRYVSEKYGDEHKLLYVFMFPIVVMWISLLVHLIGSVSLFTTNERIFEIVSGIIGFIYAYGSWFYIEFKEFDKKSKLEKNEKASDQ